MMTREIDWPAFLALNCPNLTEHPRPAGGVVYKYPFYVGPPGHPWDRGRWLLGLGYVGGYSTTGWRGNAYDSPMKLSDGPDKVVVVDQIYASPGVPLTYGSHTKGGYAQTWGAVPHPSVLEIEGGNVSKLDGSASFVPLSEMSGWAGDRSTGALFYW